MKRLPLLTTALLLAAPLASHALHICTDGNGKSSFQDKPCETRDASAQFAPLKATAVTEPQAIETVKRITGAMGARDVVAMQRLLSRSFESRIFMSRDERDPILINADQMSMLFTRTLQAAKSYQVQRNCSRDKAATPAANEVALLGTYKSRLEVLNRKAESTGDEFVRVGLENGELKVFEISEPKAIVALRSKAVEQAAR